MSKPEIVTLGSGYHNENLPETTQRLIKGGSWKKQRCILLIPAGDTIPAKVYLSHCGLIFPPNQAAHRMLAQGMEVGEAFSSAIDSIVGNPYANPPIDPNPVLSEFEFLVTLEHDNIPPQDGLIKLIERMEQHPEFSWISSLYFCKGFGGCTQIWGDINDPIINYRPMPPDPNGGLVECYGTGMGFAIWRLSMFKDLRLRRPFFKTLKGLNGEGVGTQDLYFSSDARKYGYRCAVDCSVRTGHFDLKGDFGISDFSW